jgi:hypothetical protein
VRGFALIDGESFEIIEGMDFGLVGGLGCLGFEASRFFEA